MLCPFLPGGDGEVQGFAEDPEETGTTGMWLKDHSKQLKTLNLGKEIEEQR